MKWMYALRYVGVILVGTSVNLSEHGQQVVASVVLIVAILLIVDTSIAIHKDS